MPRIGQKQMIMIVKAEFEAQQLGGQLWVMGSSLTGPRIGLAKPTIERRTATTRIPTRNFFILTPG
jgi:hypothetical protein